MCDGIALMVKSLDRCLLKGVTVGSLVASLDNCALEDIDKVFLLHKVLVAGELVVDQKQVELAFSHF